MFIKADFHSAENIARSTFSAHFLLNCSNQIQISEHISKESEREKSIARHFPLNGNPPLEYKVACEYKNIDFDADKPCQYNKMREEMAKIYQDDEELFGPYSLIVIPEEKRRITTKRS